MSIIVFPWQTKKFNKKPHLIEHEQQQRGFIYLERNRIDQIAAVLHLITELEIR